MIEIKTADQLADPGLEARWAARRNTAEADVLRAVLREFVERSGPVAVEDVFAALPDQSPGAVRDRLARLDADDLIQLGGRSGGGRVPLLRAPQRLRRSAGARA